MATGRLPGCHRSYAGCTRFLRGSFSGSAWRQVEARPEAGVPRGVQNRMQSCNRRAVLRSAPELHINARALDQQVDEGQRLGRGVLREAPDLALDLGPVLVLQPPVDREQAEPDVVVRKPGLAQ